MSENNDLHNWDVYLKGNEWPQHILQAQAPQASADGVSFISFADEDGQTKALYPTNAVAAITRSPVVVGTYPLDQTPTGAWLRNVKTDGTGHWVPYTGPLFGIKE